MDINNWITLLQLLLSFFGGLIAVLFGQILSFHRENRKKKREIENTLRRTKAYIEEDLSDSRNDENLNIIARDLEKIYVEYDDLLTEKGKNTIRAMLDSLDTYISPSEYDENKYSEMNIDLEKMVEGYLKGMPDHFDEKLDNVTLWSSTKRFFGIEK